MKKRIWMMLAVNAVCAISLRGGTVAPTDNGNALINPGMGWTMHFYSNLVENYGSKLEPSDALDWFDGCSVVYLRVPWSFLEPEEGNYQWSLLDTPAQRWIERGKKVAFRFTTAESWLEYPTPKWVFDAGAKSVRFTPNEGIKSDGAFVDPIYDDPIFLEKLEKFLAAAGKRYNKNPNVAFIDVGTYGTWGEGHTVLTQCLDAEKSAELAKIHIKLHKKYFPDKLLVISDDVIGHDAPGDDFPLMKYVREQGITLRDDSILVQPPPRSWFHAGLAQKFWPDRPIVLEHEHYGGAVERGSWNSDLLLKAVEDYHASYMSIHWWPEILYQQELPVIEKINRRLGYRFNFPQITFPDTVVPGQPNVWQYQWANVGVAPCYQDAYVAFTLKDSADGIIAVLTDEGANGKDLPVAPAGNPIVQAREVPFTINSIAPQIKPGDYRLFLSVGQADGTPMYQLPYEKNDGHNRYEIGTVTIKK